MPWRHKIGEQSSAYGCAVGLQWNDQHGIAGVADQRGYAPHRKESEYEGNHGNHALQPLFGSKQLDEHADGDAYDGKLLQ